MPSKRASTSTLDAAAAASAPKSKKRSSRPKPRMDGHADRNPNSHDSPAGPSRKSERKRKPRSFPDSTALALAVAPAPASSAAAGPGGGHGAVQKLWTDADEVALLTGAAAFRARTGTVPRLPDMAELFDSLKSSLSSHLDQAKVYYKLKRLKSKFLHATPAAASGPHDRRVRDLCADLWGADLAPPAEENVDGEEADEGEADERDVVQDAATRLPLMTEVLGEYWRANGRALSGVSLEKGAALLGVEEGRFTEAKWRRQLEAEMRTRMRRHDLAKEVYGLLVDAVKGIGP